MHHRAFRRVAVAPPGRRGQPPTARSGRPDTPKVDNNQFNIKIRIAGQEPIPLTINREDEETARQAEFNVNRLYNNYIQRYRTKTPAEILAMVAYRFAELLFSQVAIIEKTDKMLDSFEGDLNRILLDVGEADSNNEELTMNNEK